MQEENKSILDFGPSCWKWGWEISRQVGLGRGGGAMSLLGADYGFPAGLGDAFRPGFWLCVAQEVAAGSRCTQLWEGEEGGGFWWDLRQQPHPVPSSGSPCSPGAQQGVVQGPWSWLFNKKTFQRERIWVEPNAIVFTESLSPVFLPLLSPWLEAGTGEGGQGR